VSISFYQPPQPSSDEEARIRSVDALGALEKLRDPVLDEQVHRLRRRFGTRMALLSLLRDDSQHIIAGDGLPLGIYDRRRSFCGHAVENDAELFWVGDLSADPRFAGNPWVSGEADRLRFYAAGLVRDSDGLAIGAICVADARPRDDLTAAERALLVEAGRIVSDRLAQLATLRQDSRSAGAAGHPTSHAPPP
jgi:GAF domain-containing protein